LRPSHPLPNVRDDRETPLRAGRDGERYAGDLRLKGMKIFLKKGLDRQITFLAFSFGSSTFVIPGLRYAHPGMTIVVALSANPPAALNPGSSKNPPPRAWRCGFH
jgi:hypothetical protein